MQSDMPEPSLWPVLILHFKSVRDKSIIIFRTEGFCYFSSRALTFEEFVYHELRCVQGH